MRRRKPLEEQSQVPASLLKYREQDWTGPMVGFACHHPECRYWEAIDRWEDEHPRNQDPGAPPSPFDLPIVSTGPDVPFHPGEYGQPPI